MTGKTLEQIREEMLIRMFESIWAKTFPDHPDGYKQFEKNEHGMYVVEIVRAGFYMFCEGRELSGQADRIDPKTGLKACPWCGSFAMRYPDGEEEGYSVMCSGEHALFGGTRVSCPSGTFAYSSQKDADDAWNTRA